jgi:hypothetical protein
MATPSVPHRSAPPCHACGLPIDREQPYRKFLAGGHYEHAAASQCEEARRLAAEHYGPLEILTLAAVRNHVESAIRSLELRARDEWRAQYLAKRAGDTKAAAEHDATALKAWSDMDPLKAVRVWLLMQIERADAQQTAGR